MIQTKIKAMIIDDEIHCRSALRKQLEWSAPHVEIIGEYEDAITAEAAIRALNPDLLLLDVEMPQKNGFDLLKSFDEITFEVIFTTAYNSFALEAFRVNAIDYLLKPIDEDHLIDAIDKVAIHIRNKYPGKYLERVMSKLDAQDQNRKISFPTSDGFTFISLNELIRCEAEGSYSYIYFGSSDKIFISKNLKYIENLCKTSSLVRVHQSHLINIQ